MIKRVLRDEWRPVFVPVDSEAYPNLEEIDVEEELWDRYVIALNAFKSVREELNAQIKEGTE